jgi:hypothetical protein
VCLTADQTTGEQQCQNVTCLDHGSIRKLWVLLASTMKPSSPLPGAGLPDHCPPTI